MIKCQEVIITDLAVRQSHDGKVYRVLQVYDKEGKLIAEDDVHEVQRLVMEKARLQNEVDAEREKSEDLRKSWGVVKTYLSRTDIGDKAKINRIKSFMEEGE